MRIKDKYISPFTDFGFKKLFGTEMNKDILMDFLNELLKKDEGKIVDLSYLPLVYLHLFIGITLYFSNLHHRRCCKSLITIDIH